VTAGELLRTRRGSLEFLSRLLRAATALNQSGSIPAFHSHWSILPIVPSPFPLSVSSMIETVTEKGSQVSEHRSKSVEMSSETEMTMLVHEAADFGASSPNWKERVHAAARLLSLPFSRAKAHYYREARRVDAGEMDYARAAIRALREQRGRQKAVELVDNLNRTVAYLRSADPDGYSADIAALEHALSRAGVLHRALAGAEADYAGGVPAASAAEIR
jgi:hypothetical protein